MEQLSFFAEAGQSKGLPPEMLEYRPVYGDQLIWYWKHFCEVVNEQLEHNCSKIIEEAKFMYNEFFRLKLAK